MTSKFKRWIRNWLNDTNDGTEPCPQPTSGEYDGIRLTVKRGRGGYAITVYHPDQGRANSLNPRNDPALYIIHD